MFSRLPIAVRLLLGLILLNLLGTGLLMLPWMSPGEPLKFNEAIFTAASALCVTGLSIITPAQDLTPAGKIVLMLLIQMGGVGYMVLAILVFQLLGRTIGLTDRMALQDALGLINLQGIITLAKRVLVTVLCIELIGGILLYLHWRQMMPDGRAAFYAMFHAVSAFCNAGFDLFTGHPEYPGGVPTDTFTMTVIGGLIVLGGLGIPVLYDLITYYWNRRLSLHTRLTLRVVVGLILWGTLGLMISETRPGGTLYGLDFFRQFELSMFQSISARTAGFAALPRFETMDQASQLLLVTLMFIGCAPASMGGGVTTGTFVVLVLAMFAYAKGQSTPLVGGRAIPGEMVRKAAAVLTISLFAVLTATWLLLMTHPITLNQAVFEVVSAFATCGLTLATTSQLNPFGQAVIILMMIWGRLGALTILFAFTRKRGGRRVTFPEEKVLIG